MKPIQPILILLLLMAACASPRPAPTATPYPIPTETPEPTSVPSPWTVHSTVDAITDEKRVAFFTQSTVEAVRFPLDPPTLFIQCWAGRSEPEVLIHWGGAFVIPDYGGADAIRWGGEPATTLDWVESPDHKMTFLRDFSQFLGPALRHPRVLVRLYDNNGSTHNASFNLTGLDDAMAPHWEICKLGGKSDGGRTPTTSGWTGTT